MDSTCHICYCSYNEVQNIPMLLTCGHTLCSSCLEAILKTSPAKCPFDNSPQPLRPVSSFNRNFALLETVSKATWNCAPHRRKVVVFCRDCAEGKCEACLRSHMQAHFIEPVDKFMENLKKTFDSIFEEETERHNRQVREDRKAEEFVEKLIEEKKIIELLVDNMFANIHKIIDQSLQKLLGEIRRVLDRSGETVGEVNKHFFNEENRFVLKNARFLHHLTEVKAKLELPRSFEDPQLFRELREIDRARLERRECAEGLRVERETSVDIGKAIDFVSFCQDLYRSIVQSYSKDSADLIKRINKYKADISELARLEIFTEGSDLRASIY